MVSSPTRFTSVWKVLTEWVGVRGRKAGVVPAQKPFVRHHLRNGWIPCLSYLEFVYAARAMGNARGDREGFNGLATPVRLGFGAKEDRRRFIMGGTLRNTEPHSSASGEVNSPN